MSTADTHIRARIEAGTKERASDALEAMGLSICNLPADAAYRE